MENDAQRRAEFTARRRETDRRCKSAVHLSIQSLFEIGIRSGVGFFSKFVGPQYVHLIARTSSRDASAQEPFHERDITFSREKRNRGVTRSFERPNVPIVASIPFIMPVINS